MRPNLKSAPDSNSRMIWWICLGAIAIILLNAIRSLPHISDLMINSDVDDLMRLQEVRDWLAGQSWFDTRQYRVLPPEGISMHWSRYIDAGIAAILVPASWMLTPTGAEQAAVILWPTLLACLMVLVIGHANNRLMGKAAAIGSLAIFLTWSKLGGEFATARIDHHNVQMLCGTAIFYLSLLPGRPRLNGAFAGGLLALSLAVGLEMLPYLAVIWGMMILRHAFGEPKVGPWLLAFCAAIAVAAPALMAGQTPVAAWGVNHCDVLAPPVLALGAIGIAATLVPVLWARTMPHPAMRILVPLVITGVGVWFASPLLLPCLAGPYAAVAPEVRTIIETRVVEALSAATLLQSNPAVLGIVLLPPTLVTLLALGTAWRLRHRLEAGLAVALIQAFVVTAVGFAFALVQIRAANLMVPAIPLLGGFLLHAFALLPRSSRLRVPAILVLLLSVPAVVERGARHLVPLSSMMATKDGGTAVAAKPGWQSKLQCRTTSAMAEIASLPPSVVFASLNLGPAIVAYTPQATTSASYHRNMSAFWNGIGAFESRNDLKEALTRSRADYLVICVGSSEERLVTRLADEGWPDWLDEVTETRTETRMFRVDKAALARADGAP